MTQRIAYLCDHKACKECHPDDCHHTHNIEHAENFERVGNITVERGTHEEYAYVEKRHPYAIPLSYVSMFMRLISGYGVNGYATEHDREIAVNALGLLMVNWKHDTGEFVYRGKEDD